MTRFCPRCGEEIDENIKFCPECGHSFVDNVNNTSNTSNPQKEVKQTKIDSNNSSTEETAMKIHKIDPTNSSPANSKEKREKVNPVNSSKNKLSSIKLNKKTMGIIGVILLIVIIAVVAYVILPNVGNDDITIYIKTTDSYATNLGPSSSGSDIIDYSYSVSANLYSSNSFSNLEKYNARVIYLEGDTPVKTMDGYISQYDGKYELLNSFGGNTLYNITNVQIEIVDNQGNIIASETAPFTMGDMSVS